MEERSAYECMECGNKVIKKGVTSNVPECCGKDMTEVPIEVCDRDPAWAEHARIYEDDEPCDPGISGNL